MPDHKFCQHINGWLYSESNFFNPRSRSPAQSFSSNNRQNARESPPPSSRVSNTRTMVPGQSSPFYLQNTWPTSPSTSSLSNINSMMPRQFSSPIYLQNARQVVPSPSGLSITSLIVPGHFSKQTTPPSSGLSNTRLMVPGQFSSSFNLQNARQMAPPSSLLSDLSSMVPGQFSSPIYLQNARPTSPSTPSLSNINLIAPGQFSSSIYLQNARQVAPSPSSLSNTSSIVPGHFSKQTTPPSPCLSERAIGGTLGNISTELFHSRSNTRQTAPFSSCRSNTSLKVPGHFSKQTTTPLPCLSKRVTRGNLGDMSTEILHFSSDYTEKSILETDWAPIEIPDSPSREKSPYQHDESRRAKRAREEKSEVEICSGPVNKMKKAKVIQQSQNQIIERPQHESELPSIQVNLDITNRLAACDDIQFEEKDLLPEDFKVQDSADGFSYDEESIDDFIGLEDIAKIAIYSIWDRMVLFNQLAANSAN